MNSLNLAINILCVLSTLLYLLTTLRYDLQMMQQNSYRNKRYMHWLRSDFSWRRAYNFVLFLVGRFFIHLLAIKAAISGATIIGVIFELRKKYKKKLVFTPRAIRLYATSIFISLLIAVVIYIETQNLNYLLISILTSTAISPWMLILSNIINAPMERAINRWYYRDAKRILSQNPNIIIIGITGSYGKTSTKHYLHRILSEKYNVLMTPGSYNTTLGVIRTIRENLKPYHEVFIVEMGAKQAGDIKEICDLVHPTIGILTSVGEQHLESFKTILNVQKAKFELIDSLPKDGLAVLNFDYEYITSRPVENTSNVKYYSASDKSVDYYLDNISYSNMGSSFSIDGKGVVSESFFTQIVGSHNLSNILAGSIVARELGVSVKSVQYGVSHIEQVEHRLNIKKTTGGITIIDDAFNSNPSGAQMALDVLSRFEGGKRIIVTPGLIELGDKQFEYNSNFGAQISNSADYVIVVGAYNRDAIMQGLTSTNYDQNNIYQAPTFTDAISHLGGVLKSGDIVLYENDLPDTFK